MAIELVFETHAPTEDNDAGRATGWLPGRLTPAGRRLAAELGWRRRDDRLSAVFSSDLGRAVETTTIAFGNSALPVLYDWRLRECDYGTMNGAPVDTLRRGDHVDVPYPQGESWWDAVVRVGRFLDDLELRWDDRRVLVVGHTATRWAFDTLLTGASLRDLVDAPFEWRKGWEYRVP